MTKNRTFSSLIKTTLFALGLAVTLSPIAAQAAGHKATPVFLIKPFTALYGVHAFGLQVADINRTFSRSNGKYHFENDVKSTVFFYKDQQIQKSNGLIKNGILMPMLYTSYQTRKKRASKIQFNWAKLKANAMKNNNHALIKLLPGTQDFISAQIQLRQMILEHETPLKYDLVKSNKLQTYHFKVIGHPVLETAIGKLKTLELQRVDGPRITNFWLALKYQYLLVQSDQSKGGSRQALIQIEQYQTK